MWQQTGSHPTGGFYADLEFAINDPVIPSATREYNPWYYRWLTPDPGGRKVVKLDNPQTWNMYAYALDNPTTLNDPSGMAPRGGACTRKTAICTQAEADGVLKSRLEKGLKGGGEAVLGVGLVLTGLAGDVPGGVVGTLLVANAEITGTALSVKGTVDIAGASTNTGVSKGDKALEATGNLGGLATTAGTGNLKAGRTAATLTSAGVLVANPMEATRSAATLVEAGRTAFSTIDLARSVVNAARTAIKQLPPWLF